MQFLNFSFTLENIRNIIVTFLDIFIMWLILYYVLRIVRNNSRTIQIFKGVLFIIVIDGLAKFFGLKTLQYLADMFLNWGFLAVILVFQPEIRALLERMGKSNHAISGVFVFLLLGIFAIFSTLMVVMGAKAYRGMVERSVTHNSARVASSYIRTMLRSNDESGVLRVEEVNGVPTITMENDYGDMSSLIGEIRAVLQEKEEQRQVLMNEIDRLENNETPGTREQEDVSEIIVKSNISESGAPETKHEENEGESQDELVFNLETHEPDSLDLETISNNIDEEMETPCTEKGKEEESTKSIKDRDEIASFVEPKIETKDSSKIDQS